MNTNRTVDRSSSNQSIYNNPALARELSGKIAAHTIRVMANKTSLPTTNKKH